MSTIKTKDVSFSTETSKTKSVSTKTSVSTQVKKIKSNELVRVRIIPYTRAQKIYFKATGLRPNCRHFAFFDQVAVDDWCREETFTTVATDPTEYGNRYNRARRHPEGTSQLFSDAQGTIEGSFFLPNTNRIRFRTGDREFRLIDISVYKPNRAISTAFTVFASNGRINYYRDTYLKTTTILTTRKIKKIITTTTTKTITVTLSSDMPKRPPPPPPPETTPPTGPPSSPPTGDNDGGGGDGDEDDGDKSFDVDGDGKGDYHTRQGALKDGWESGDIVEVEGPVQGPDPGKGPNYEDEDEDEGEDDGNNDKSIVCTAMNNAYGFGSFRQKIWLEQSIGLPPEYEVGYHAIGIPLVRYAYKSQKPGHKILRKILEHLARRRTSDIWKQKRGKRDYIGAVERAIIEPLCYVIGWVIMRTKGQ